MGTALGTGGIFLCVCIMSLPLRHSEDVRHIMSVWTDAMYLVRMSSTIHSTWIF
jgi:hypothetical protein